MYCGKCGEKLEENAKFCGKCGTPVHIRNEASQSEEYKVKLEKDNQPVVEDKEDSNNKWTVVIKIIALLFLVLIAIALGILWVIYYFTSAKNDYLPVNKYDVEEEVKDTQSEIKNTTVENETTLTTETVTTESETTVADNQTHSYKIIKGDVTWEEAFQLAKNQGGYLVNIETEEEMQTITNQLKAEVGESGIYWIGAKKDIGEYHWINDTYMYNADEVIDDDYNWLENEPTYYDMYNNWDESYVNMFYSSSEERWAWNDAPNDIISVVPSYSGKVGYIVEIE